MHEMSYILRMIHLADEEAEKNGLKTVDSIEIRVGEMTGLLPDFLSRYYKEAVKGTRFSGSLLKIDYRKVKARCLSCGEVYFPSRENAYSCPHCKSLKAKILEGREFDLVRITGD